MDIKQILKNTIRIVPNVGVTEDHQFFYNSTKTAVDIGVPYHIRYTVDLKEYYLTGGTYDITSQLIDRKKGATIFGSYSVAKRLLNKTVFLKPYKPKLKDTDYELGTFERYFARQVNNIYAPIFEIKKIKYNAKTPFYKKYKIETWRIIGPRSEVIKDNVDSTTALNKFFDNANFLIDPLEFWKPTLSNKDITLQKLKRLWPFFWN